jgi:hypothetical protein
VKKTVLKPWLKKQWGIPEVGAEFVAALEDVLEVSAEPYDPARPKVNCDETTKQRIQETRQPLPAQPGQLRRYDDEDARNGMRNLLLFVEPQAGRRYVHGRRSGRKSTSPTRCSGWWTKATQKPP